MKMTKAEQRKFLVAEYEKFRNNVIFHTENWTKEERKELYDYFVNWLKPNFSECRLEAPTAKEPKTPLEIKQDEYDKAVFELRKAEEVWENTPEEDSSAYDTIVTMLEYWQAEVDRLYEELEALKKESPAH